LEKIKKCVIEYPAVVRLKELNAEREIAEEQKRVSIALEEAPKAEAKPVMPTEASGKVEQSNVVIPFDKTLGQKR